MRGKATSKLLRKHFTFSSAVGCLAENSPENQSPPFYTKTGERLPLTLTLTLSPRRGNSQRVTLCLPIVVRPNSVAGASASRRTIPPLPKGEGRGEGKATSKLLRKRLALFSAAGCLAENSLENQTPPYYTKTGGRFALTLTLSPREREQPSCGSAGADGRRAASVAAHSAVGSVRISWCSTRVPRVTAVVPNASIQIRTLPWPSKPLTKLAGFSYLTRLANREHYCERHR